VPQIGEFVEPIQRRIALLYKLKPLLTGKAPRQ
jgi:hypothetical protein